MQIENIEFINKQNITREILENTAEQTEEALDNIWKTRWIRETIMKKYKADLADIKQKAEEIRNTADAVVIVAEKSTLYTIEAALSAVELIEDRPEIYYNYGNFSSLEYEELFQKLEGKRVTMIAISPEEKNTPEFNGAYAIFKHYIFSRRPKDEPVHRIYGVLTEKNKEMTEEITGTMYPAIWMPKDIEKEFIANTAAVLLPLAVKGADIEQYLEGFYKVITAVSWDYDGTFYARTIAEFEKRVCEKKALVVFQTWQKEFEPLTRLLASIPSNLKNPKAALYLPKDREVRDNFEPECRIDITIGSGEGALDIMTPVFEGCSEEGALNSLVYENIRKDFFDEEDSSEGFEIRVPRADSQMSGELMAFLQLSHGIINYITK